MTKISLTLAFAMVLCLCNSRAGSSSLATKAPASIELSDQYGVLQKLNFPTTTMTLLTIADRKGSEQIDGWISLLKPRYGDRINLRGIADVGGAPSLVHGMIRKKFQETRKYPVMLDWSGQISTQLGYKKNVANILIIGCDGSILGRISGAATDSNRAAVLEIVDKSLAMTPPR